MEMTLEKPVISTMRLTGFVPTSNGSPTLEIYPVSVSNSMCEDDGQAAHGKSALSPSSMRNIGNEDWLLDLALSFEFAHWFNQPLQPIDLGPTYRSARDVTTCLSRSDVFC